VGILGCSWRWRIFRELGVAVERVSVVWGFVFSEEEEAAAVLWYMVVETG
jgi:hypothetical protein